MWMHYCVLSFLNSLSLSLCFSGVVDDVLLDHYDMMSYDLSFFGRESDDEY